MGFNPYVEWLGRPEGTPPASYYELLGVDPEETDVDLLRQAIDTLTSKVRRLRPGAHLAEWEQLLDALHAARVCLLDSAARKEYDARLNQGPGSAGAPAASLPPVGREGPSIEFTPAAPSALNALPMALPPGVVAPADVPSAAFTVAPSAAGGIPASAPSAAGGGPLPGVPGDARGGKSSATHALPEEETPQWPDDLAEPDLMECVREEAKGVPGAAVGGARRSGVPLPVPGAAATSRTAPAAPPVLSSPAAAARTSTTDEEEDGGVEAGEFRAAQLVVKLLVLAIVALGLAWAVLQGWQRLRREGEADPAAPADAGQSGGVPAVGPAPSAPQGEAAPEAARPAPPAPTAVQPPPRPPAPAPKPPLEESPGAGSSPIAPSPTPEELARQEAFRTAVEGARARMAHRNLAAAKDLLGQAAKAARTPDEHAELARLKTLWGHLDEFWRALGRVVASYGSGQDLPYHNTRIMVLEADAESIVLRSEGSTRRYSIRQLPYELIEALARDSLTRHPSNKVLYGTYLAFEPQAERGAARKLWDEAARQGQDTADLLPELLRPIPTTPAPSGSRGR